MKSPLHILIGGGTSWIGSNLRQRLIDKGHHVTTVDRRSLGRSDSINWNEFFKNSAGQNAISLASKNMNMPVDAVVSLSGAPIMDKPWTQARKNELRDSRILATEQLVKHIMHAPEASKPVTFVGASATGIFNGIQQDESNRFDENYAGPFNHEEFVSKLCCDWEAASKPLEETSTRRVIIRISPVLSKIRGIVPKLLIPGGVFCVGRIGSGEQRFPWIHIHDLVELFISAIENKGMSGVFHGVSPQCPTQAEFSSLFAKKSGRVAVPLPGFMAKLMFGERSSMLLDGANVAPLPKTDECGFKFRYSDLETALDDIFCLDYPNNTRLSQKSQFSQKPDQQS
ncbi:epimerase family protein SDR39U1-like [Schistocerca gregaria]|uniref:epimerase family protein SDR39U1-like n=1 Tax=Schistocerca gregaria TaxID=7010 RepID=UPI00211E27D0|nr:epimerase family protein SDR39U1-like [Schistocerca gregaria]